MSLYTHLKLAPSEWDVLTCAGYLRSERFAKQCTERERKIAHMSSNEGRRERERKRGNYKRDPISSCYIGLVWCGMGV